MRNEHFGNYTPRPPRCPSCARIMRFSERLGLMTLISSMSLNAERVACRTLTPWKSRQHKRRFQRSYRQARGKRLPAAQRDFSEPIRDADEQNTAGREEQNFEGDNSGQHRQCIMVERPLGRRALWGFLEKFEANKRALPRLFGYAP